MLYHKFANIHNGELKCGRIIELFSPELSNHPPLSKSIPRQQIQSMNDVVLYLLGKFVTLSSPLQGYGWELFCFPSLAIVVKYEKGI